MKYLALCLTAVALATAGAASAQSSAPGGATSADAVGAPRGKPAKPKKVCRERMRSGSHLTNVVCKTPEQWAELQAEFDDQAEYGIPGNRVMTAREINVSPLNGTGTGERPN
jgi:hypothetical protein